MLFETRSGLLTMAGVLVALVGVVLSPMRGTRKVPLSAGPREFNREEGTAAGRPLRHLFLGHVVRHRCRQAHSGRGIAPGVKPLYAALPSYVVIMGGGAVINFSYCFIRLAVLKRISSLDDLAQPSGVLLRNGCLAATGGIMWYLQFFFYAWGAATSRSSCAYVTGCCT